MGKSVFVLDQLDYQRSVAVLPATDARTRLETRLRKTHDQYRKHLRRRDEIAAEMASVTRELARRSDPDLLNRLTTLQACYTAWPDVVAESAAAFGRALAAWAAATHRAFVAVAQDAILEIDAPGPQRRSLVQRIEAMPGDDPDRQELRDEYTAIGADLAPARHRLQAARSGASMVQLAVNRVFPEAREAEVGEHLIRQFANRHRTPTGVTAA